MTVVPIGIGAYRRNYGRELEIKLVNRFVERQPSNQVEGVALLSRPGTTPFLTVGSGILRRMYAEPGIFNGELFIIMGTEIYRYDGTTATLIGSGLAENATPEFAAMKGIGYEFLFFSDGTGLYYYSGGVMASGTLTASGAIVATDTIEIGGTYYSWTAGSVDAGTPDGTILSPFLVALGSSNTEALLNMRQAINRSGISGTTYSTTITEPNPDVSAPASDATTLSIQARAFGDAGNNITTTETGANISFGSGTLTGGTLAGIDQVAVPDGRPIRSVAAIGGYVVAVAGNSQLFFWLFPGEVTIDPLDFASARENPDDIINALTVADQVWFLKERSVEAWYVVDNPDAPFAPIQGRVFARGVVEGTAVKIDDNVILVGDDGIVYSVGGGVQRLSNNGIEERIRLARQALREMA